MLLRWLFACFFFFSRWLDKKMSTKHIQWKKVVENAGCFTNTTGIFTSGSKQSVFFFNRKKSLDFRFSGIQAVGKSPFHGINSSLIMDFSVPSLIPFFFTNQWNPVTFCWIFCGGTWCEKNIKATSNIETFLWVRETIADIEWGSWLMLWGFI